jgi:hypothetical protein
MRFPEKTHQAYSGSTTDRAGDPRSPRELNCRAPRRRGPSRVAATTSAAAMIESPRFVFRARIDHRPQRASHDRAGAGFTAQANTKY